MGCHTWCYAHIPTKQEEWEEEFINSLKQEELDLISDLENGNITDEILDEYAKCRVFDDNRWLKDYNEAVADGDEDLYIKEFGSREKLNEYINSLHLDESTYTGKEIKEDWISEAKQKLNKLENCTDVLELMKSGTVYCSSYGIYIIRNDKIYRDTTAYRGKKYMENTVFPKQYHDIFRIYDYDANPCYSLEETLKRCEEYNVDWNEMYEKTDIKMNNKDRLIEFWETYPDSIIEFG